MRLDGKRFAGWLASCGLLLGAQAAEPLSASDPLQRDAAGVRAEAKVQHAATTKGLARAGRIRASHARAFDLGPPAPDAAVSNLQRPSAGIPLQVGFGRDIPGLETADRARSALDWQRLADGSLVAALSVTSSGAASVRAALRVDEIPGNAIVRFQAPQDDHFFEVSGDDINQAVARNLEAGERGPDTRLYWSALIEGDTILVEVELAPDAAASDVRISVPRISHLVTSAAKDFAVTAKSASCEVDATCSASQWGAQMNAVARMIFTSGGSTYVCTGTLLADRDTSSTIAYFLSANHCIATQTAASSLTTYWFYRSSTCNGATLGPYRQLSGGAALLHATTATDTAFLRLNNAPPTGAVYAGWFVGATPSVGTSATGLHHPQGDWLKISNGSVNGYLSCTAPTNGSFSCNGSTSSASAFYDVRWTSGITEPGSSGSGLFRGDGLLIGQLYGGGSDCITPGTDIYGRFDVAYNAALNQWLSPSALTVAKSGTGSGTVTSAPAGINCGTTCNASFPAGTSVTLSATPAAGSSFAGWSGACSGTGSCQLAMTSALNVTASFAPNTAVLSVSSNGGGTVTSAPAGIDCGSACSASFTIGTPVTLSATPAAGMIFMGWSGACSGTGACTISLSQALSVTASFGPAPSADLALTQSAGPNPASAGKDLVITLTAVNKGPGTATGVSVTSTLPAGASFIWASPGCAMSANTLTCSVDALGGGLAARLTLVIRPASAGSVTSSAMIEAIEPDPVPANNSSSATVVVGAPPAASHVLRYRLYSPVTQEHLFTTDLNEYSVLGANAGWVQEGTVGKVLDNPGAFNGVAAVPYYRLYSTTTRWHHWTTDPNEYYTLTQFPSWNGEGVDGYILPRNTAGATELYRLVYPDGRGLHHWTNDANENSTLVAVYGWVAEPGAGFVIQ
jgi:uncharacterized repeat protein (TIGR01451 family)